MRLFLMRHALAADRDTWQGDDRDRPLVPVGEREAELVAQATAPRIKATQILTSPATRCMKTAEIAARAWKLPLVSADWLLPDAEEAIDTAQRLPALGDVVIVGHEPELGTLAGLLLGGRPLAFKKSALAAFAGRVAPAGMRLRWLLTPKIIATIASHA